jgi:hypothetical protein
MHADDVEALRATIHRLRAEGRRPTEIARLAGCSRSTVYGVLVSGADRDRRRRARASRVDPAPDAGQDCPGLTPADHAAAAAADPDSMDGEIRLLRALIHSLESQVSAMAANDRSRPALIRLIRELTDSLSRVFRASRAVPATNRDQNLDELADAGEVNHPQGQPDGTHDPPPARQADAGA